MKFKEITPPLQIEEEKTEMILEPNIRGHNDRMFAHQLSLLRNRECGITKQLIII